MTSGSDVEMRSGSERISPERGAAARSDSSVPGLLVSVRSRQEAIRAIAGGAEIIDIKEPTLGSLGMADVNEIAEIARVSELSSGQIPLSVALGELRDWPPEMAVPVLPPGIAFAKLGLSDCRQMSDWKSDYLRIRAQWQSRSRSRLRWVAVAYADAMNAASPDVAEVLSAAIETDCAGLLIDTWRKDGRRLPDEIDMSTLLETANRCHRAGLFFALAGRLDGESLKLLAKVPTDVIGIRSAACRGADRTAELDSILVAEFRGKLQVVWR